MFTGESVVWRCGLVGARDDVIRAGLVLVGFGFAKRHASKNSLI